jgi:polygalacturonase
VVEDFGAKGDNKTEDTAAVSAALAACSSVLLPAGHTFLLRPVSVTRTPLTHATFL